jgi:hypothetical protein
MKKEIVLTPEELDEIKDDIKFREKVLLQLKQLNGVPKKVWQLDITTKIQGVLILGIILGIVSVALKVGAK